MDTTAKNQYRAWAAECRERAKQGQSFKAIYDWIKLAQSWELLADGVESQRYMSETDTLRIYNSR